MRIEGLTHTSQTADPGVGDSKRICCTKLKMSSFPSEPEVRDGPGLPRDHSHFPESEEMDTIGLMEWSCVVMVAGEEQMSPQPQPNNVSCRMLAYGMWPVSQPDLTLTASPFKLWL